MLELPAFYRQETAMLMRFDPFREVAFRELDRITATYDRGVLTLVVPVSQQAKPRPHCASAPASSSWTQAWAR
jgi:hypothetical protein